MVHLCDNMFKEVYLILKYRKRQGKEVIQVQLG